MQTNRNVIQLLHRGYESVIDLIYPHTCPICECIVDKKGKVCKECEQKLKYIVSPFCMVCGKSLTDEDTELCFDCIKKKHSFDRGVAAFSYSNALRKSMYNFKYNNRRENAAFYADAIYRTKGHIIKSWDAQVYIPVPIHKKRMKKRGYNQAELIANELSQMTHIPVDSDILMRVVNTTPQKELNDKERAKNLKNAFQVRKTIVQYKKIVLVDDIYTTGATLDACAKALKEAGAEKIYFVAACIGTGF